MLSELWSEIRYRVRAILRRRAVEKELEDELRFHVERETAKYVLQGQPIDEARRRAHLAFGGVDVIKEEAREARGTRLFDQFQQDTRYALRGLRRRPSFTVAVVTTLALGIGANSTMFGVLDRLLFRPPAYLQDPSTVHRVYLHRIVSGRQISERRIEYATYADLVRWSRAFSETAAFAYRFEAVGMSENVTESAVAAVSSTYFDFFSAKPVIGRVFNRQEDEAPFGLPVAVLAHSYWKSRYGGRSDILGSVLRVGRESYEIIGVAPAQFEGVSDQREPVVFVPITRYGSTIDPRYASAYNWSWVEMLTRVRPGMTLESATADLTNAYRRSWQQLEPPGSTAPSFDAARAHATLEPVQLARGPDANLDARVAIWVSGVAMIVLLIACANVANLLLVRALRRRRELVLRHALGGSRSRLARQLLVETLVFAVFGGAVGLLVAQWAGGALRRFFLDASTAADVLGDARTLIFAFTLTLAVALVAGLAPALHTGRIDLAASLRAGMRDATYRRLRTRNALVMLQAALSVILLVASGLVVRSHRQISSIRLGYDPDPIVYVRGQFTDATVDATQAAQLRDRLIEAALRVPGVTHATPMTTVPFRGGVSLTLFVPGVDSVARLGRFNLQAGSDDYFATAGTRILRGRGIQPGDRPDAPRIVVVSESMANALWPGRDAIGQCIRLRSDTVPCTTVVGIAENVRMSSLTNSSEFHYYVPHTQYRSRTDPRARPEMFVRVSGRGADFAEPIRRQLQDIMPGLSYVVATPLQEFVRPAFRPWQLGATLFTAFGVLALALAAIGLYSVIQYGATQRTHELGVRLALGARRESVVRIIVGEGLQLTIVGAAAGCAITLVASPRLSPLLFQVSPREPAVYAIVMLTLISAGIMACAIPAIRAALADPNRALRSE